MNSAALLLKWAIFNDPTYNLPDLWCDSTQKNMNNKESRLKVGLYINIYSGMGLRCL